MLLVIVNESNARTSPDGWTLGFGGISVEGSGSSPFPVLQAQEETLMVLPNVSYKQDQWQFGTDGIVWKNSNNNGHELEISAGYPASRIQLAKVDRWKSYSLEAGLHYADGLVSEFQVGGFGVSYQYSQGLADRERQLQHQWSTKVPILIAKDNQSILFATGSYTQENKSFALNNQLSDEDNALYTTKSLGVFFARKLGQQSNLVGSISIQNPETTLRIIQPELPRYPVKVFFMYSFYLGKKGYVT